MRKIFDRHFVIFAVLLCGAIGAFLAQKSPQYAPFSVESNIVLQNRIWGGAEQKSPHAKTTALSQSQRVKSTTPHAKSLILPNATKSAHSSSIADLGENLMVVYFAGSREGASDVAIMAHFVDKRTLISTPQRAILDAKMLSLMSGKFIKKLGNPVIFRDKNGALHLFVVGVSLGGWATAKIYQLKFRADLQGLDFVGELHLGLLANFSHLVRTPPIALENGGFALPYYHELARKYALVGFFNENAKFTRALRLNRLKNQLQPTIIALNERECLAFFRNHKAHNNDSFLQQCGDFGAVWGTPKVTNLKGYDDSALLVSYANAQNAPRILLIYNDGRRMENGTFADSGSTRQSLGLYALKNALGDFADKDLAQGDSTQDADILAFDNARFSTNFAFLQNIDTVSVAHPNEVSYPSAVISGEWLFVAYTHNRKNIKIMRFNLAHLEAQIAQISDLSTKPRHS